MKQIPQNCPRFRGFFGLGAEKIWKQGPCFLAQRDASKIILLQY